MAYRNFENEKTYAAPEIDILPKTMALIQSAQQTRQRQQQQNRQLAATYQADKLASNFTTDQQDLNALSNHNTQAVMQDYLNHGVMRGETREKLSRAMGYKQLSDAQWKMKEDLEKAVNDRVIKGPKAEKNYYDKSADQQRIIDAAYGQDHEQINFNNRDPRLRQAGESIGKDYINSFNKEAFLNDYIDELKNTSRSTDNKGQSGIKSGNKVTAVFFDENGVPKVTDNHAISFLDSSPDVRERYRQEVDLELIDDAKKIAASPGGEWVKDLQPQEVVQRLRENPSLNTVTKTAPGERERQLAKQDLEKKQKVSLDNSYDASDYTEAKARGNTSKIYNVGLGNYDPGSFGGGGFVFTNNRAGGMPGISISIKGDAYDKNSKQQTGNRDANRDMSVTSANLGLVDSNGNPIDLPGKNVNEQIAYLNTLEPDVLNGLNLKTLIHGQSINNATLSQARRRLKELQLKSGKTEDEQNTMKTMEDTLAEYEQDPNLAPEILQKNLGITVEDLVKPVEPGSPEENQISTKLGKFKITDKKNWDSDMTKFAAAFQKIKQERAPEGFLKVPNEKPLPNTKEKKAKVAGPKAGEIIDGYKFLGGDPSKESSWQKQ